MLVWMILFHFKNATNQENMPFYWQTWFFEVEEHRLRKYRVSLTAGKITNKGCSDQLSELKLQQVKSDGFVTKAKYEK